ncbi:MAG: class II aldolase/adducin family protein [Acidimicrobiaceae bacterium]|nr:class II aldolase/adducin family protein [Acidimicrobiaceae bacterium]MDE0666705.1 class II aldolase/adducin family protein [Acidimicrobiaceae bacterium]
MTGPSNAASDPIYQQVVDAAQEMERAGLTVGTAGNVSGRRGDGAICLTPSSTPYADVTPDNLAVLSIGGEHLGGSGQPSTEKAMHLACYNAFAEVGGVVHCHAPHASMFAVAHRPIPASIEEVIVYVGGDVPVADYAVTGTQELADEVVRHLDDRGAVLMANHGLLCVGKSPADALHTALVVEHTAKIMFGAQILGGVQPLPAKTAKDFAGVYAYIRSTW